MQGNCGWNGHTIFGHYFEITDGKMSMFMAFDDTLSSANAIKK